MKWFLISEDDARAVSKALLMAYRWEEVGSQTEKFYNDALHTLNAGLHITDAAPADFQQAQTDAPPT